MGNDWTSGYESDFMLIKMEFIYFIKMQIDTLQKHTHTHTQWRGGVGGNIPGEKIPSPRPSCQPMMSLIFFSVTYSSSTKTGATSYVNLRHKRRVCEERDGVRVCESKRTE